MNTSISPPNDRSEPKGREPEARSGSEAAPGPSPESQESEDPRARARRRLLKLAVFAPPTLLTLSSLSGFLYGMKPKPSVATGVRPQTKPK